MPSSTTLGRTKPGNGAEPARDEHARAASTGVAPTGDKPTRAAPSKVVFVGPLTTATPDGSTVKNNLIVSGLRSQGVEVRVVDTGDAGGASRLSQLRSLLGAIFDCNQVIVSVSQNGFATLVPLLGVVSAVVPGMRFAVVGMGSGMPREIASKSSFERRYFDWALKRATGIYVQGEWISRELEDLGFQNASVLANLRPRPAARWSPAALASRKLVFISRVIPDKGVERAMTAVERLRAEGHDVTLDIYGPVPDGYSASFDELLAESPGSQYLGVLRPDSVPDALAAHAALVLPTTWAQEGMPGILVEAAMVGTPVIASALTPIAEVVEDGVSGLLVDPHDVDALTQAIRKMLTEPDEAVRLAEGLSRRAATYDIDVVIGALNSDLVASGWR